ncbi:MAG: Gfo/Idh/MocA family oxidoreductase [Pirellulaceae bacterium]
MSQPLRLDRRRFLASTSAAVLGAGYFAGSLSAAESDSPNERLNIASIGTTGRAGSNLRGVATQNIVAMADVDDDLMAKAGEVYRSARRYRDFRTMLDKEAEHLDAVLVSTADHTHAAAAAMAMKLGKHVYCEKPLTHTVVEARTLADLAEEKKLVTQMGTQIHAGDNYRRVVELVQSGAIGPVREAHVWVGVDYAGKTFGKPQPAPKSLAWDLWLGPAPRRAYSEGVHPFNWRWFWDYGTGGLGDFGCHYMDLVHWALDLRSPTKVSAEGPKPHPLYTTSGLTVKWQYPARDKLPPVELTWYDGGRKPKQLADLKDAKGKPLDWKSGQLLVGSEGMIVSDYGKHLLLPVEKFADFKRPEPFIPNSIGHHAEWLRAIRSGGPTTCNFRYSGALTEAVLLGVAAYRSGETIDWDAEKLVCRGAEQAQHLMHTEYRQGWEL